MISLNNFTPGRYNQLGKIFFHYGHCITMVLCHIPHCSSSPNAFEGCLILKIIYYVTKYLIKHHFMIFLSSESAFKISSDIYVIRHITTM